MSSDPLRFTAVDDLGFGSIAGAGTRTELRLDGIGRPERPLVFLDGDDAGSHRSDLLDRLIATPAITVVVAHTKTVPEALARAADLVLARPGLAPGAVESGDPVADAEHLAAEVRANPVAAVTLAWLLRSHQPSVLTGLAAESAAYSMLLAGSEFQTWLAARGTPRPPDGTERIRLQREGDLLRITLARPGRRNAVDTRMRHELVQALQIGLVDPDVRIELAADGPSFSAGGDLDEFGTATDPATAHLVRVAGGAGGLLHALRDRVTVRVHGACIGAGIELPAFTGHVVARRDAVFGLPEVSMGLIPGAGGTVSIPARIGRGRTLWFALSGRLLDARTALDWGLIDELE